jgi:hypothetical protein
MLLLFTYFLMSFLVSSRANPLESKPLAVGTEQFYQDGRCHQKFEPVSVIKGMQLPAWYGGTWNSTGFSALCQYGDNSVAKTPLDTPAEQMAKYYFLTYKSSIKVFDYRDFEKDEERVSLLEYFWKTGDYLFLDPPLSLLEFMPPQ